MSGFRPARLCAAIALGAAALVSFSSAHAAEGDTPRVALVMNCLLYTSPSPRDLSTSRMPSSA